LAATSFNPEKKPRLPAKKNPLWLLGAGGAGVLRLAGGGGVIAPWPHAIKPTAGGFGAPPAPSARAVSIGGKTGANQRDPFLQQGPPFRGGLSGARASGCWRNFCSKHPVWLGGLRGFLAEKGGPLRDVVFQFCRALGETEGGGGGLLVGCAGPSEKGISHSWGVGAAHFAWPPRPGGGFLRFGGRRIFG